MGMWLETYFYSSHERHNSSLDSRPLRMSGVPALFIPGNAGSHKQSRSSASIALRMQQAEFAGKKHFDFFTVNLNEVSFYVDLRTLSLPPPQKLSRGKAYVLRWSLQSLLALSPSWLQTIFFLLTCSVLDQKIIVKAYWVNAPRVLQGERCLSQQYLFADSSSFTYYCSYAP